MVVEMTAVRALQPFFGSTTYVWTNVIAVVLAALAAGYHLGGRLADRRPSSALYFALLAAGGLLVAGSAPLATPVARLFLDPAVDLVGIESAYAKGSLGATLILVAPGMLVLGAAAPFAVRVLAHAGVGRAAGRVSALTAAGSIAGTYLPAAVLVPLAGSRGSLLVAAALAVVPGAAGLVRRGGRLCAAAVAAVLGLAAIALVTGTAPGRGPPPLSRGGTSVVLAERESPYHYLTVRDDCFPGEAPFRVLTINEGVHTYHALRTQGRVLSDSRCYDDYSLLPLLVDAEPGAELRMGVVGFACGVNAAQWRHFWGGAFALRIEGAELDPEVLALGREFFGLLPPQAGGPGVVVADGRQWLETLPPQAGFHALVLDAFAHELYVPFHLGTREFFELCRRRVVPGGILAMNVYAVGADAENLAAIENTLATVFGACIRASQHGGNNYMLLARGGGGVPDVSRWDTRTARRRLGERADVAEWDGLLALAATAAQDVVVVEPRPGAIVLTDDHAPLERLTDRFLDAQERRVLGREPGAPDDARRAALLALLARQDRALALVAAAWAVLLAAAAWATGRVAVRPR
jgi:spermidine synthase